jgi:hypothetical protein
MNQEQLYKETVICCWNIFINLDNSYNTRLLALEAICSALRRLEKIKDDRQSTR